MNNTGLTSLPPLSLYIHIPWCVRKCPYCDFNSHAAADELPEDAYIDALIDDLNQELPAVWGRRLQSVFIGGGTPSLFSARSIDRLLGHIHAVLPLVSDAEITLEANPGTFEARKFTDFRSAGVNRLSIGIQSFNDEMLKKLGRIHDGREARRAIETAPQAGFDNFNLDLMYALPGQTTSEVLADLEAALAFSPSHLSQYQLTIEPNTLFHSSPPSNLPDNDLTWEMQQLSQQRLEAEQLSQYEVSAYARKGRESRHNMNYWQFGDYIGIGAGAHGKISRADNNSIARYHKPRQPKAYMQSAGKPDATRWQLLEVDELPLEFMLNTLRLKAGFDPELFPRHTGLPLQVIEAQLAAAETGGLLYRDEKVIRPTEQGYLFLNDLLLLFMNGEV